MKPDSLNWTVTKLDFKFKYKDKHINVNKEFYQANNTKYYDLIEIELKYFQVM